MLNFKKNEDLKNYKYFTSSRIELAKFNDLKHLSNHLNYLFRVDSSQKWTNEESKKNKAILYYPGYRPSLVNWCPLEERKRIKSRVYTLLKSELEELRYVRIECDNPNIYHWNKEMFREMLNRISDMEKHGYEIFVAQIHDDQPDLWCHFHLIVKAPQQREKKTTQEKENKTEKTEIDRD